MDNQVTNVGELYNDDGQTTLLTSATATFNVLDENTITMTKVVDRPNEYYAPGDQITFTITITNNGTLPIENLFFRDEIDAAVEPLSGTNFIVTTTDGTITSFTSPVTISDINIGAGGTVVITITGRIV